MHSFQGDATAAQERARQQAGSSTSGSTKQEQDGASHTSVGQLWKSQTEPFQSKSHSELECFGVLKA